GVDDGGEIFGAVAAGTGGEVELVDLAGEQQGGFEGATRLQGVAQVFNHIVHAEVGLEVEIGGAAGLDAWVRGADVQGPAVAHAAAHSVLQNIGVNAGLYRPGERFGDGGHLHSAYHVV